MILSTMTMSLRTRRDGRRSFVFDLLFLDGEDLTALPLVDRKTRLNAFLVGAPDCIRYVDHQVGQGPAFYRLACEHGLEGIVSKRINGRYEPDRRSWLKTKCLNREEFVVVGWSDPEGSRHRIGALLLVAPVIDFAVYL
jgi:bifunctional non-homologous end joining protein LigD